MAKSVVYLQSGGPTAVINSSLYGAYRKSLERGEEVERFYGSVNGVEGLINDDLIDMSKQDAADIELLKQTPGAILGSSRHKIEDGSPDYGRILDTIKRRNIGYVLVNGGNDSMDTCCKIAEKAAEEGIEINVIGIPKTVDNDLCLTDHTPGFGSAAKYVVNEVKNISIDASAYQKGKVVIVEVMGRDAGWLAASSGLIEEPWSPDFILLPEVEFDPESFLADLKARYEAKGRALIVMSEAIDLPRINLQGDDGFGHQNLEGSSFGLGKMIQAALGYKARIMLASTAARSEAAYISRVDQQEAIRVGEVALEKALAGETGKMVVINRLPSQAGYFVTYGLADLKDIANATKRIPSEWIDSHKGIKQELKDYIAPLIKGEPYIRYKDGVVMSAHLRKENEEAE